MPLRQFFDKHPKVALAFSGGTDSAFLLYAAKSAGADVRAYYVKTPFQPQFEWEDAAKLAEQLDVPMTTLEVDVLGDPEISSNPKSRCYHCKRKLLSAILAAARQDGYGLVIDGTNASDAESDRPGMQALAELQVRSPLRECGITKENVRRLSKEAGLFTHDKPAYACLATRIPAGIAITADRLEKTERSEAFLRGLGFTDFRVRLFGGSAKLQLTEAQLPLLLQHRQIILEQLKNEYDAVLLDLEVRP